ncbi:MAG: hypothetical protein NC900_04995 [Candidatus Omnitrophica bacterium]|nr:hypothetical protein [Candidatus Omnitrophota bacterium]MCM8800061.1 hypothetical protein [Candidatus Omnitrophota bacterium]
MKNFLCLFILTYLILGCGSLPKSQESSLYKPLEPTISGRFTDIPIPGGFKLLQNESYSFFTDNVRVAVLKYSGRADAERVINFYKEQMPIYNWDLINIIEYGRRLLNFENEKESCIISIEPKKFSTKITISLGPKTAKKIEKPIK